MLPHKGAGPGGGGGGGARIYSDLSTSPWQPKRSDISPRGLCSKVLRGWFLHTGGSYGVYRKFQPKGKLFFFLQIEKNIYIFIKRCQPSGLMGCYL